MIFVRCWRWWKQTSKEIKEDKVRDLSTALSAHSVLGLVLVGGSLNKVIKEQTEAEERAKEELKKSKVSEPESTQMEERKPPNAHQEIIWPTYSA